MDTFRASDLRGLTREQTAPCVTIYLPTHVTREAAQQDPVRLKNLLQQAEQQLADRWIRGAEARDLLEPARDLPTDPAFWEGRSHGLAIFLARGVFHRYRLPLKFDELAIVNRRFHVKPLLPLLAGADRFFLLTLSQNNVALFAAARFSIERVDVNGLPANLRDALNYTGVDRGSQVHSAMRGSLGKQAAVFHGHGGQADTRKEELTQFFRLIDSSLQPVLRDERTPLLLAGVDYLLPIYREVNSYAHLARQELVGNCDCLTPHELHQRAWPLMEPTFQRAREEATARYRALAGTGKTSDDIRHIVSAAHEGRIDALFVDAHDHSWGQFDWQTGGVELHESCQIGDDDLLDLAAVQTLTNRGTVYCVGREHLPSRGPVAALFRY